MKGKKKKIEWEIEDKKWFATLLHRPRFSLFFIVRPRRYSLDRSFIYARETRGKREERLPHSLFLSLFSHFILFLLILALYFLSSSSSCFLSGINIPTTGLNTFTVYLLLAMRLDIPTCISLTLGRIKDSFTKELYLFFFIMHQLSSPKERS